MKAKTSLGPTAALLAGACLSALAACAGAPTPDINVPTALEPGRSVRALATVSAKGVQVYECRNPSGSTTPAWVFVAPEAQLFDERGRSVGSHGAGPYWMALDGSQVVGSVRARADAPANGAIPWLLLTTQSVGTPGFLSSVSFIQRVNTIGGIAPAKGCDAASVGQLTRVGYRADYRLFVPA
jgi:hypothetical protein